MKTKKQNLVKALTAIAAANLEGYTVDAHTLQPITSGYAVAVIDTQNSFGTEGLERVINYVTSHKEINAFGGWYNKEDGQFYFDATVVVKDFNRAIDLARMNKQIAFYCLHTGITYDQDGNEIKD